MTSRRWAYARRGLALITANFAVLGVGFLIPLTLAHLAAPEDYGRFSFVTALVATLSILTAPGLATAVTQGAARGEHGTLRAAVRGRLAASVIAAVVLGLVGSAFVRYGDRTTGWIIALAGPLVIPAYGLDLAAPFLNGCHRYRALAVVMLGSAAVPAAAVVAALALDLPITVVTLAYFAALGAANAAALSIVSRRFVTNDRSDEAVIRYGRRLSWISSLGAVQFYFDRLVIGLTLGFADVAIYSTAKFFQQGMKTVWTAANQQLFPRLAAGDDRDARRLTAATLLPLWLGFGALAAVGAAVAPVLVPAVFGAQYVPSVTPARLLMLAVAAGIPGAQFEMMFRAIADERRLYTQRITFTVAEIACTGLGAWLDGVRGASIGMILAYTINSIVGALLARTR